MNVLSLFDGMSCGQIALNKLNKKIDNFYASEIDKHAIKVTQHNFPNTIQLGDVSQIQTSELPNIDLLIGGSPCQSFSNAGNGSGFDGKSGLFYEYVRILNEVKPKYFLLENVKMKKEWQDVISEHLGTQPIRINSSLVSAQNRERLYWTNIPNITPPDDKNILVSDILEKNVSDKYYLSGKWATWMEKNGKSKLDKRYSVVNPDKAITMLARQYSNWNGNFITDPSNFINGNVINWNLVRKLTPVECERLQNVPDNYSQVVSDNQRYKMLGNGWTVDIIVNFFKNL